MKAWLVYGINDMRLEDIPVPKVKPGWLLARVKNFQASITEIQRFLGISDRGLDTMAEMIRSAGPMVMGHELCGEIADISEKCDLKIGDRIAYYHQKEHVAGRDYKGCFAEYVLLPISSAVKMDETIPDIEGPGLQPLSDCVCAVKEANIKLNETVAIFGQGVMGMNITQLCHLAGARHIIGIDVRDQCLKLASSLGADITINPDVEDPIKTIEKLMGGKGVDVAFECASGDPQVGLSGGKTLFNALKVLRSSGRIIQISFFHDKPGIDLNEFRSKSAKYIFPELADRCDMMLGMDLVAAGKLNFKPLITHVMEGLEKLPEVFEITAHKSKYGAINPVVLKVS